MSGFGSLIGDDEEKKKLQEPSSDNKGGIEHAWNWFKYHAEQRVNMMRFYIVALGGIAAAVGYLNQQNQHIACCLLSLFAAWVCFCFLKIDRRTSELVKVGEQALRVEQMRLSLTSNNPSLNICDAADNQERRYMGTYSKAISALLGWAMIFFLFFGFVSACYSEHLLIAIHQVFRKWA